MNSFSTHILREMDAAERQEAEWLLLGAGERGTTGPRAIQGTPELKSSAAVPLIRRQLPPSDRNGTGRVRYAGPVTEAALALLQTERYPVAFCYPEMVLHPGTDTFTLIDA